MSLDMNRVANCAVRYIIWVENMITSLVLRAVRYVICWHFFYYVPDGTLWGGYIRFLPISNP